MTSPHTCLMFSPGDTLVAQLGLGAAALRYQSMGYSVLGLGVGSKRPHPLFEHGVKWATTDHAMVPWLWGQSRLAGVGVATGQVSRLVVVDLDVKAGENGTASFTQLLGEHGWRLPACPTVVTPSGGYHLWLRIPASYRLPVLSRPGILPGVDIKADGGYVVVAPSRVWVDSAERSAETSGRVLLPYRWAGGCPCSPPDAPGWLLDWVAWAPATGTSGSGGGDGGDPVDLAALKASGLPVGQRNVTLHKLACSLYRRYGTSPDGATAVRADVDAVLAATPRTGGFGRGEIERALRSALSFVKRSQETEEAGYTEFARSRSR